VGCEVKTKQKRIALIGLQILQSVNNLVNAAIARHAEEKGRWHFVFSAEPTVESFRFLRTLDCDGAIVRIVSTAMLREAKKIRFPLVNVSSWLEHPGVPTVRHDFETIGRIAAEHLLEKGYRRFGCVIEQGGWFIEQRYRTFVETIGAQGCKPAVFTARSSQPLSAPDLERFVAWVRTLRPPAALLLTDDWDAPKFLDGCRAAGFEIPRDLVVISTGMHSEVLSLCRPALSAAQEDQETLGDMAVKALDELMAGRSLDQPILNVPPLGVVERESTATFAIEDREVAHAVEFIRAHAGEPINVCNVVDRAGISRVTLERRFRQFTRLSLHAYLVQHRVRLVQERLLQTPPPSLQTIALQCGFPDRRRLNQVFRHLTGKSPAAWRQANLTGAKTF